MPRPPAPPKPKFTWKRAVRVVLWTFILAGAAWGAKSVNAFLLRDPRFELECPAAPAACADLRIHGAVYTSPARVRNVFARDFGGSVFHIPLAERRRRLLALDWVDSASISRVWPNRIDVFITERRPAAFAKLPLGGARYRFSLIDSAGVLLSIPLHVRFSLPVLSGVDEDQTEAERAARVRAMQSLLADLGPRAKDISEVNAADPRDMRVIAELGGHAVELWIGDQNFRARYTHFLDFYDEIRRHSDQAAVFDLRMDDRILAKQ